MTEEENRFDIWKSKVELYLEQMIKKSCNDFKYDYERDFKNNISPNETAMRVVKRAYRNHHA
jgi:hypothetical protein